MAYTDRDMSCVECGQQFTFTSSEQEFFASRGYTNDPKRCPSCREARRSRVGGMGGPREMHPAVCARCNEDTQVPFQPRGDRPVYCSSCFSLVRAESGSGSY